jgi:ribosomal protein L37E
MQGSTFLGLEHQGELAQCRSCGHPVRSRTAVCPHCGAERPARHRPALRIAVPAAVAVLGALGLALVARQLAFQRASQPAEPVARALLAAPPDVARPIRAAPPVRRTPATGGLAEVVSARQASGVADSPAGAGASLQTRWVADWSNMRRAPANEAAIVRVLPPDTEVRAAPSKWGWWAIVWQGDTVGYIAGALLRPSRPAR